VAAFRGVVAKPLTQVSLADLQQYADRLAASGIAPASQARALAALKSLFAFGQKLGYFTFDVARVLKLPTLKQSLAERILTEKQALRLVREPSAGETPQQRRDRVIVLLLQPGYGCRNCVGFDGATCKSAATSAR
jgi:integrase/recombinase XerD